MLCWCFSAAASRKLVSDEEMLNEAKRAGADLERQDPGSARDQTGTQLNIYIEM